MYMYNCTDILTLLSICTHAGRKCPQPEYSVRPVFGTSPPSHTTHPTRHRSQSRHDVPPTNR